MVTGPRRVILGRGSGIPSWVPLADGAVPSWYDDFTTNQYLYNQIPYSAIGPWLTALGGTFTRASNGGRYNSSGIYVQESSNVLRFDYDPVTLAPKGILLEGARTNILYPSNDFSVWGLDNGGAVNPIVTQSYATGPDGVAGSAARVQLDRTGGSFSRMSQFCASSNGSTYAASVWMRKNGAGTANVGLRAKSTGINCALTSTWTRFQVSAVVASSAADFQILLFSSIAGNDVTADILVFGAQLEVGAFASSYIPTTSGSVTRAADSPTFPTSPWFNASAGTLLLRGRTPPDVGTEQVLFQIDNGASNNRIRVGKKSDGKVHVIVTAASSDVADLDMGALAANMDFKIAFAFAANDFAASLNGDAIVSDASGAMPSGLTTARIGADLTAGNEWFSTGAADGYWPFRVTNAELQRLTNPG